MKKIMFSLVLILGFSQMAAAHDEGHGPMLADTGKYGGLVSAVVLKSDAGKGAQAPLVYKAELVRSTGGDLRVYFYDKELKPLDVKSFKTSGSAAVSVKVSGKWKSTNVPLALKEGVFIGKMSKPTSKPYNIDVTVNEKSKELLSAFDNLD